MDICNLESKKIINDSAAESLIKAEHQRRPDIRDIIEDAYRKMFEDGTLERIARQNIESMVDAVMRDQCAGYRGTVRGELEKRIIPIMVEAIDRSNLNDMTVKLTDAINQALQDSPIGTYKHMLDGINALCGEPRFKFNQELRLSDVFKAFCASCESALRSADYDKDELEPDENGEYTIYGTCVMHVDTEERYYGAANYTVEFRPECDYCELDDITHNTYRIQIHQTYDKSLRLWLPGPLPLALDRLNPFMVYLMEARSKWVRLVIDQKDLEEDFSITLDE